MVGDASAVHSRRFYESREMEGARKSTCPCGAICSAIFKAVNIFPVLHRDQFPAVGLVQPFYHVLQGLRLMILRGLAFPKADILGALKDKLRPVNGARVQTLNEKTEDGLRLA